MDRKTQSRLVMGIESQMRRAYSDMDCRVFWPEQFLEVAKLEDVLRAFKKLAEDGKIELIVDARCQDGHRMWSGPPENLAVGLVNCEACEACEDPTETEVYTQLRAELSHDWEQQIQQELGKSKKKAIGCLG